MEEINSKIIEESHPGKTQCEICNKWIDNRGFKKHYEKCNKHKEAKEQLQTIDKISEQEKSDLKQLSEAEEIMASKKDFAPGEIDELREKIRPTIARQTLRDEVAREDLLAKKEENLKRQRQAKKDRDDDDELSWKQVLSKLKADALMGKNQNQSQDLELLLH